VTQQAKRVDPAPRQKGWKFPGRGKAAQRDSATQPMHAGWRAVAHKSAAQDGLLQEQAWTLWHRFDKDGWHNFVLRHNDKHFRKFSYWGAWNGQRFAAHKDLTLLREKHPQVYTWLEAVCRNKWT
jgi:hypothetical protein